VALFSTEMLIEKLCCSRCWSLPRMLWLLDE